MLFNIAKGIAHKVPLTNLVLVDSNLCPYLAVLLVAVRYKVGNGIQVPKKRNMIMLTEDFEKFLANEEAKFNNNYDTLARYYRLHLLPEDLED